VSITRTLAALALAGGVLATAACDLTDLGSYDTAAPAPAATPSATPVLPAPRLAPAAAKVTDAPPTVVLRAHATAKFGTLVTDARGFLLYRSDKDSARPPRSTCTGACLKTWRPALLPAGEVTAIGVDPKLVGSIARPGGVRQLTLAGWPVYTFAKDRPGTLTGQCKAGFFGITPEGDKTTMRG
jgi:predicted lipoprotein with Yx(FWY)xxD motif